MDKEKVKLSFAFSKKDYEHCLFLLDRENDPDAERVWKAMAEEELEVPLEFIAKQLGVKKMAALMAFVSIAVAAVEPKIK